MRRSVCRLLRSIYGHTDSGTYWEEHCDAQVLEAVFTPVMKDTWPSCYFCAELRLYLVVYVDDFILAGPTKHLEEGWARLRRGLDLGGPAPSGLYLGDQHDRIVQGTKGAGISYNMESFFKDCVAQYVRLTGYTGGFRTVTTPFLVEDQNTSVAGRPPRPLKGAECP